MGGENQAVNLTMLHWGFNAWSVYALMAWCWLTFRLARFAADTALCVLSYFGGASMALGERQSMSSPSYAPPSGSQLA